MLAIAEVARALYRVRMPCTLGRTDVHHPAG
jgi:hypothetical protein